MAHSVLTAVQSDVFWRQCHALQALARPVSDFSAWLRACPCHEAACLAERDITCAWKGCRAPELSARVSAFSAEMLALRDKHASHEDTDIEAALTRMLAVTQLKFAWVDDLPCFIWQVCSPASAAAFLAKFDTSAGPQHRVTLRFAAGEFRPDMEAWAQGADVSSRLRLEVQSYHWCKLDDTWAEAAHRDVSRISKRATFASQAWQSASLRTQQNLDLWDSLDAEGRARFDSMFYRWKAIGQLAPRLALSLIRRKQPVAAALHFVYRTGSHALVDWSVHLREALDSATHSEVLPELSFAAKLKVVVLRRLPMPGKSSVCRHYPMRMVYWH